MGKLPMSAIDKSQFVFVYLAIASIKTEPASNYTETITKREPMFSDNVPIVEKMLLIAVVTTPITYLGSMGVRAWVPCQ